MKNLLCYSRPTYSSREHRLIFEGPEKGLRYSPPEPGDESMRDTAEAVRIAQAIDELEQGKRDALGVLFDQVSQDGNLDAEDIHRLEQSLFGLLRDDPRVGAMPNILNKIPEVLADNAYGWERLAVLTGWIEPGRLVRNERETAPAKGTARYSPPEKNEKMRDTAHEIRRKANINTQSALQAIELLDERQQTTLMNTFNELRKDGVLTRRDIDQLWQQLNGLFASLPKIRNKFPEDLKIDAHAWERLAILAGWVEPGELLKRKKRVNVTEERTPPRPRVVERREVVPQVQLVPLQYYVPGLPKHSLDAGGKTIVAEMNLPGEPGVTVHIPVTIAGDYHFVSGVKTSNGMFLLVDAQEVQTGRIRQLRLPVVTSVDEKGRQEVVDNKLLSVRPLTSISGGGTVSATGYMPNNMYRPQDVADASPYSPKNMRKTRSGYEIPSLPTDSSGFPNNYGLGPKWGNVGPINIRPAHDGRQEYASPDVQEVLRAYEAIPKADYPQMAEANPQFKPFIDAVWREHYKIDQDKETWIMSSPKRREWVHNLNNARRGLLKLIEGGVIPKGAQPTMAYLMAVDSVSAARAATAGTRMDSPSSSLDRPYPLPLKTIRVNAKDKGYMYSGATTHITGYGPVDSFGERKRYEFLYNPYRNAANEGSTMSAAKAALGISVGPADAAGQFDISFMRPGTFEVDGRPVTVEGAESAPVPVERPKEREGLPLQFQYVSFGSELPRMIKVKRGRETVDMNISEMQPGTVRYFDKGINVLNDARYPGWYKINFYEPGRYEVEGIFDRDGSRAFASIVDVAARTAPNAMASRPNQEALQQELARVRSELDAVRKEKGEVTDQVKKLVDQIQALQKQLNSISG